MAGWINKNKNKIILISLSVLVVIIFGYLGFKKYNVYQYQRQKLIIEEIIKNSKQEEQKEVEIKNILSLARTPNF